VDIGELIAGYIPLKRAGRNFKALCPFHHEKTPSFMISTEKQIYHCFGCGAGGNAISFLMQYERLEFPEAIEVLAKKTGVILAPREARHQGAVSLNTQLYKVHEAAVVFYRDMLQSPAGKSAKGYLLKRGITEETISSMHLGYAPDRWDALIAHLRAKGISLVLMEKAGLIVPKTGGGYYDRFRNRIIFPIYDIRSRAIAYGARVLPQGPARTAPGAEEPPKYVNSPETALYSKGKNLYGIHLSKDAIRREDRAVIVEGYLDFIMPFQEGAGNVVAGLGTAFTPEQVNLLKRYTHNVVIIYDPDDAGQLASLRALDLFVEEGMNVKVASLPKGQDPDLFVRTQGIDKFKALVSDASSLLDYKLGILKGRYDARQIEGKAAIAAEILPTIKKVKNAITQAEYIRKLAEELDIDEHSVQQELKNTKEEKVFAPRAPSPQKPCLMNPTEKLLVKLMLQETSLIEQIRSTLEPADFQDERASRIVSVLFDLVSQGRNIESRSLINQCRDEVLEQLICESALQPEVSPEDKERIVEDCIKRLKSEKVRMKKQYLHEEIKTAQHLGDDKRLSELMQEFLQLTKVR